MNKPTTAVIKNDEVVIGGRVRLGSGGSHAVSSGGNPVASQGQRPTAASATRIVRTAEDHVLIEVTCACGTKTMVRCNF